MPTNDSNKGENEWMPDIKRVIDYSGMPFSEVLDLPCDTFRQMLKNSVVDTLNQSEQGQEYLRNAERFKQTKPDIKKIKSVLTEKVGE